MNVHLKGVFFLTQRLLPMIADGGRIVNVSSGLARFSLPGYAAYAAMKSGVEALSRVALPVRQLSKTPGRLRGAFVTRRASRCQGHLRATGSSATADLGTACSDQRSRWAARRDFFGTSATVDLLALQRFEPLA
jgi:NAD(P)-dependent dehydrogenase (short-subunit alcohol dehydrogenase family)